MRFFVVAMTVACLVISSAPPVLAQSHGGRHKKTEQKTTTPAVKADDKAYKSALDRLPTQSYDPWGTMRPADQKH